MKQQIQQPKPVSSVKYTSTQKPDEKFVAEKRGLSQGVTEEQRHRMIAEAAYLLAEQRNFEGDLVLNDWLQAEAEVGARISKSR